MSEVKVEQDMELNLALEESAKGYVGLYFTYYQDLAQVIMDSKTNNDYRIVMLTNLLIETITDRKVRVEIKEFKEKKYDEFIDKIESPSQDDKDSVRVEVCFEVIGEISSWMDRALGITHKVLIGSA